MCNLVTQSRSVTGTRAVAEFEVQGKLSVRQAEAVEGAGGFEGGGFVVEHHAIKLWSTAVEGGVEDVDGGVCA